MNEWLFAGYSFLVASGFFACGVLWGRRWQERHFRRHMQGEVFRAIADHNRDAQANVDRALNQGMDSVVLSESGCFDHSVLHCPVCRT